MSIPAGTGFGLSGIAILAAVSVSRKQRFAEDIKTLKRESMGYEGYFHERLSATSMCGKLNRPKVAERRIPEPDLASGVYGHLNGCIVTAAFVRSDLLLDF